MRLDSYLRRLACQKGLARRVLGTLAARLLVRRDYYVLGFARLDDYTRERLGMSKRELQSVARTVTVLASLPCTARAFETGRICWTKARLIASIAPPETERAWLERALTLSASDLQSSITATRSAIGDATPPKEVDDDDSLVNGEPRADANVACPARVRVLWRQALELARCAREAASAGGRPQK
jgi:hypothetical protein